MRSVLKAKASCFSGASPRSAGRKVVHGLSSSSAHNWFWWKKQSSHVTRFAFFAICRSSLLCSGCLRSNQHRYETVTIASGRLRKGRVFPPTGFNASMELVTGASGYVGGRLVERLRSEGRAVRALSRDPERLAPVGGVEAVRGDLLDGSGLDAALDGCSVAYYLVHSMESDPDGIGDFASRDRRAAERFAVAATAAGVERVVYLGGLAPQTGIPSAHISSRVEVEEILLDAAPGATALRASILIGARSASFRILVRLVERLRLLPLPAWRANVTRPIAERDAIEFLARTAAIPASAGRSLDIAGPDVLSYGEMIERIAEQMGVGRTPIGFGVSFTPPASVVVAAVTGQPLELVRPLMESLEHDLLPRDADTAPRLYGIRTLPFERAVDRALGEWESHEELAAW